MKLGPYELNTIVTGDARELAKAIPDESVDLIFTDPVYDRIDDYRWLAETAARVLRPGGDLLAYIAMYHADNIIITMSKFLKFRWLLSQKKMSSGTLIWAYDLFAHTLPILWYTKDKPRKGPQRIDFFHGSPNGQATNHGWSKNTKENIRWLMRFGLQDDIIFDPFCGGGAILSACKMLGRNYLAFEIDPDTADKARQRVEMTQPPLFVMQPEQLELELIS